MHYLLFYDVGADFVEQRARFRNEHLTLCWQAHARGELVLGGALADPADGAVLLFQGESAKIAEQFAAADPYVKNGLRSSVEPGQDRSTEPWLNRVSVRTLFK